MNRQEAVNFLLERPADFGRLVGFTKLTDLHNGWIQDMVRGQDDETLQAHRGSYKTTCVSIALADIIILLPNLRSMFQRKTDNDVKEVIKQASKILQDPHTQYITQCIYGVPVKLTTQSATEISTNLTNDIRGTSQLVGVGIGASLTGKHFDRIFTDDIVNLNDRISKAERDRTKMVYQELQNIKNRGGRIFNTGTPWHKEDCFTLMPNARKYDCYSTGLIDKKELEEIKSRMAPSLFAANYELKHIASEDVIFTDPQTGAEPYLAEQGITHVDAAYGGSDYTALTIANRKDGKIYIYGRIWQKGIEDVEDKIIELHHAFNSGKIYCEDNGDKGFLAKELRKRGERVTVYHEGMNKYVKITSYLKFKWQEIYFVRGTDEEYINQICDYNENAEHDDAPDSAASTVRIFSNKSEQQYRPLWN
jgi:predicted phage terminase large subunit-like protein